MNRHERDEVLHKLHTAITDDLKQRVRSRNLEVDFDNDSDFERFSREALELADRAAAAEVVYLFKFDQHQLQALV